MKQIAEVAIVVGSNIHWAPYYKRYENILCDLNINFDLILWNRENINEDVKALNLIEYKQRDVSDNKNPLKLMKFIMFSKFVKEKIEEGKYNKIIFLGTHGCAPVFLAKYLQKNFKNKYWLDIRDYQYEWFKPFFELEKISIKESYVTSISSKGYEKFLPTGEYCYMHNIDPNMDSIKEKFLPVDNTKIRISFIGNVRYYNENIKVVDTFANDSRFILQYFGAGSEKIQDYCEQNKIKNVKFHGRFDSKDTIKFYNETDIINNVYGNDKIGLTTALSNKLYYSVNLKIPILVCEKTYMEELSTKYKFGFVFQNNKKFPDKLYEEYCNYKKDKTSAKYEELWKKIQQDDVVVNNKLIKFLREN